MNASLPFGIRALAGLLLAAAMALPGQAQAEDADGVSITVVGKAQSGKAARLMLSGIWPVACTPELDSALIEGRDLQLRLRVPGSGCLPRATAFTLLVDHPDLAWPDDGVLRTRLERVDAQGEVQLIGFRLIEIGTPSRVLPETGFWWNEKGGEHDTGGPGQSILIEPQGSRLGVAVMGYGTNNDSAWFFGAGPLQQRSSQVRLLTLSGGGGPLQDYRQPDAAQPAASLWLEFENSSRATAWFVVPSARGGIELRPQSLVRFRFGETAAQAWEGLWVIEGSTGELRAANFSLADSRADGFVLLDAANQLWLDCSLPEGRPNSPPSHCHLLGVEDEPLGRFDDVGLDRMQGASRQGSGLSAVRMSGSRR